MNPSEFSIAVITLSTKWNFSITSWGRTRFHNKKVGGVDQSYHLLWLGMDIVFDGETQIKDLNFERDCNKLGLVALWEKDHYHLQPR